MDNKQPDDQAMDQEPTRLPDAPESELDNLERVSDLERPAAAPGPQPGQRSMRSEYPYAREFRLKSPGHLEATEAASLPSQGDTGHALGRVRRFLIGRPLTTAAAEVERMNRLIALAVLSTDALSSVAYATEASLAVLIAAGSGALGINLPIGIAVALLVLIVSTSYRQTIYAYPNGGGSYAVARENLGLWPGLLAAAALLIDYTLTVAVSVASGVDALISAFQGLAPFAVQLGLLFILILVIGNLRGVREAGAVFAVPTYIFIVVYLVLIAVGIVRSFIAPVGVPGHFPPPGPQAPPYNVTSVSILLILTAFASGCSAMTGVEAIANSVPVFKRPEARNAASIMTALALILATLFIGITILDYRYLVEPTASGTPTIIAQITQHVFTGNWSWFFYIVQFSTLLVLVLAANTSFNGFPRLASILAHDGFLPYWFGLRGSRLVYSAGIIVPAVFAATLIIIFQGNVVALINLFVVGVFTAFTLGQTGLVRRWLRQRGPQWQRKMAINGVGAGATGVATVIIVVTKFTRGAWIVVIAIPILLLMFWATEHHYMRTQRQAAARRSPRPEEIRHAIVVPVAVMNEPTLQSLAYARSITAQVIAVHIARTAGQDAQLAHDWAAWVEKTRAFRRRSDQTMDEGSPELRILPADHHRWLPIFLRQLKALLEFVDQLHASLPGRKVTVVLPEWGETRWWLQPLRRPLAFFLKVALFLRPDIAVADVPYHYYHLHGAASAGPMHPGAVHHLMLVPFSTLNQPVLESLAYAYSISPRVVAIHVVGDQEDASIVERDWEQWRAQMGLPPEQPGAVTTPEPHLVLIESPYRVVLAPLLTYSDALHREHPQATITIVLPEVVVAHWWQQPLHNQLPLRLKAVLLHRPGIVLTDVTYHLRRFE
jgi:amino acid transporter